MILPYTFLNISSHFVKFYEFLKKSKSFDFFDLRGRPPAHAHGPSNILDSFSTHFSNIFFPNRFFKKYKPIFSWEKLREIDSEFRGLSIPHTFRKFYRARALPFTFVLISYTIHFNSPSQPQAMRRKENVMHDADQK